MRRAASVAWRAFNRFQDHAGPDRAAGVAFYALLSLLPLMIVILSIGSFLLGSSEEAYQATLYVFRGVVVHLDEPALESLRSFLGHSSQFQLPGLLLLAWTSRRAFASLFSALETVFEVPGRGFARGNQLAFGMVLASGIALVATLLTTMTLAAAEGLLVKITGPGVAAGAVRGLTSMALAWVIPAFITFGFFFVVYRAVPRRVVTTGQAAAGALLATVLWEGAKGAFAYYVRNLAHFSGLYGALEAIIFLALWLEISVSVILFCGEVVAVLVLPEAEPAGVEAATAAS